MSNLPYADALSGNDPAAVLSETPHRLTAVITRLEPERVNQPIAPGKWTVREILAHLADCEIVWSWRLRLAYEQPNATIQTFEQDRWSPIYSAYTAEAALATFVALRNWNTAFLNGLSEADRQRPITHPEIGPITLWNIAEIAAGHDLHHLKPLEAL